MTTKRLVVVAVGALLAITVVILIAWPREKEPEYQSKKLSYWIERSQSPYVAQQAEAIAAVRQIGTNALPYLLKSLKHVTFSQTKAWDIFYPRLPKFIQTSDVAVHLIEAGRKQDNLVVTGFEILGRQSLPVRDDLVRLMDDKSLILRHRAYSVGQRLLHGTVREYQTNALESTALMGLGTNAPNLK